MNEEPSTAVVEAVAAREGVEPTEIDEPLYGAVDPDALDALVETASGRITFEYAGYEVTVSGDDGVEVAAMAATR